MTDILDKITLLAEPLLEGSDMFIVSIKNKPTNNIKLYLDADSGLSIEKSAKVNRALYKLIEEQELFPDGDFSLEVSSPGIDEPLVSDRQYKKNVGRKVAVTLNDETEKVGLLKEVDDSSMVIEVKLPKKQGVESVTIPLADVKKTVVQISF